MARSPGRNGDVSRTVIQLVFQFSHSAWLGKRQSGLKFLSQGQFAPSACQITGTRQNFGFGKMSLGTVGMSAQHFLHHLLRLLQSATARCFVNLFQTGLSPGQGPLQQGEGNQNMTKV